MNTSEVLNRAADLIEERGWATGDEGWGDFRGLCIEGALMAALEMPHVDRTPLWECGAYNAVADYLELEPGFEHPWGPGSREFWNWNDAQVDEAPVIEVLRACAVIEASREREAVEVSA